MLPESESSPEVHRTGHALTDRIVGFSAIFISLCSLGLAIHHGHIMDRLVEANSRPFLQFDTSNGGVRSDGSVVRELSATISNPGSGAARIDRFGITLDGHPFPDWAATLRALKAEAEAKHVLPPGATSVGQMSYATVNRSYLKGGGEVVILRWLRTDENAALWDYVDAARFDGRFQLSACYCSIFDQCWVASTKTYKPADVRRCD